MLTKNFYAYINLYLINPKDTQKFITTTGGESSNNATQISKANMPPLSSMASYSANNNYAGVCFGTGTTPADINDYNIEAPITTGLTVATPSKTTQNETDNYKEYTGTYGVTNTTSSDITITEIGLKGLVYSDNSSSTAILVDRTVLDTPITIPAGQSKQITYTIRFNYGGAV